MHDCLIILGMHRSGTSALAGAVHRLGATVGSDLVDAQDDNVRGYYEHRAILEFHERLLAGRGSAWDDIAPRPWVADGSGPEVEGLQQELRDLLITEFADEPLWAVKDPRLCYLFPVWRPVLADLAVKPRVLFAYRSASEVANSLARRNGFSSEKANLLWVNHVLSAEQASRDCPRAFVEFGQLLQDPIGELERAAHQLEIEWPHAPGDREESLGRFLDPRLRHDPGEPGPGAGEEVRALEAALAAAIENPRDRVAFDAVASSGTGPAPDGLVIEHLHQFARREAAAAVWAAKEPLRRDLSAASSRLGEGLTTVEQAVSELSRMHSQLAGELQSQARLANQRREGLQSTLGHLTEVAANLERAAGHHDVEIADLRARLDRLQHEVEVEVRLEALRTDLDYVGGRLEGVTLRLEAMARKKPLWRRIVDRLSHRRSAVSGEDPSANT